MIRKHKGVSSCKNVEFNGANEAGNVQQVHEDIFLLGSNGLAILNRDKSSKCQLSYMSLTDNPLEAKAVQGRVVIRSEKGRIYVIGRTGVVKEIYNDQGKSYYGVKDIKINGNNVDVTHNSKETLTPQELYNRVNTAKLSEIIGM